MICKECGKKYLYVRITKKYCSDKCQRKAYNKYYYRMNIDKYRKAWSKYYNQNKEKILTKQKEYHKTDFYKKYRYEYDKTRVRTEYYKQYRCKNISKEKNRKSEYKKKYGPFSKEYGYYKEMRVSINNILKELRNAEV